MSERCMGRRAVLSNEASWGYMGTLVKHKSSRTLMSLLYIRYVHVHMCKKVLLNLLCIYIYTCIHVHNYIGSCMFELNIHTYTHTLFYIYIYMYIHVYIYIRRNAHTYVHAYIRMYLPCAPGNTKGRVPKAPNLRSSKS